MQCSLGLLAERAAAEGGSGKLGADSLQQSQPQPEREFRVRGKLQEDESNLNLRLRICQPGGEPLTPFARLQHSTIECMLSQFPWHLFRGTRA